jgi:hypothetical protein
MTDCSPGEVTLKSSHVASKNKTAGVEIQAICGTPQTREYTSIGGGSRDTVKSLGDQISEVS